MHLAKLAPRDPGLTGQGSRGLDRDSAAPDRDPAAWTGIPRPRTQILQPGQGFCAPGGAEEQLLLVWERDSAVLSGPARFGGEQGLQCCSWSGHEAPSPLCHLREPSNLPVPQLPLL